MSRGKSRPACGRTLGPADVLHLAKQVQMGLPYTSVTRFHSASGLPVAHIADLVQVPRRTLMRRKAAGRLQPLESERLLRMAMLFDRALELFEGDADAARRWLATPIKALAGETPWDFARTEIGAREVEDVIGRLEHGVFA